MNKTSDGKVATIRDLIHQAGLKAEALKEKPQLPEWRPVPGVPFVEACEDGRLRFVRELPSSGMVDAQCDGIRVRASAATLHHAAWPERWPLATGPRPVVAVERRPLKVRCPRGPFWGMKRGSRKDADRKDADGCC